MISVITCAAKDAAGSIQERNIAKTVGTEHEYIVIDGSSGIGLAGAYNYAISQVRGDICVFIPDDAYFMKMNWGTILRNKFTDQSIGMIGVAGTQYLFNDRCSLTAAGRPFIKGRIVQHLENGDFFAVVYSQENGDSDVVACEGVFMAIPTELFQYVRFDDASFDGMYFHDMDMSMQIRRGRRIVVTTDIVVKKRSQTKFDKVWQHYGQIFLQKYAQELPASCTGLVPDPNNFVSSNCVDLKGKAPMETIC
ncbi:MAG TPA: glycosyltransferase [Chitinispirillaceae bacterium]|nr:glycosyltransferase [Chitinispirillaceae bacterium]